MSAHATTKPWTATRKQDAARRAATALIAGVAVDVPSATAHVCLNDGTIVQAIPPPPWLMVYIP